MGAQPAGHPTPHTVIAYIIRRLLGAIGLLFVISAVTFAIFFLLPRAAGMTTDQLAARFAGKAPDHATLVAIEHRFGFDKPVAEQYWQFVKQLVAGGTYDTGTRTLDCPAPCMGYSFRTNQPVLQTVIDRAGVTFSIAVGGAILWLLSGVAIGVLSALRKGTMFDRVSMGVALAGVSLPVFFTAELSQAFLVHKWQLMPDVNYVNFVSNPLQWAQELILPWITLAFLYAALYARLTRAGMLDTLNEDYIRTARAKGLREKTVIIKHGLRATLTPLLTVFGLDVGLLLGGAVLTEKAFGLKGLGMLALDGIGSSDLPVVVGVTLIGALFIVLANLAVDILYAVVDPRVRLS
ncbi:MAG: binding-protein-dependent transport system inner rane component [Actinomycetia bacterium]|nr:binding-protein-dependent transport system inner rane component [Actinomycetes bacterium]